MFIYHTVYIDTIAMFVYINWSSTNIKTQTKHNNTQFDMDTTKIKNKAKRYSHRLCMCILFFYDQYYSTAYIICIYLLLVFVTINKRQL